MLVLLGLAAILSNEKKILSSGQFTSKLVPKVAEDGSEKPRSQLDTGLYGEGVEKISYRGD